MNVAVPERRTAMYHAQLPLGAVMALADGWQLPSSYGDVSQEAAWLRDTVGVSDISPLGKLRVVGVDASELVGALAPRAARLAVGSVGEADSPLERGGKLLAARLTADEFLLLTPTGVAPAAMDAMLGHDASCAHVVDITSGLSGVSIIGPASPRLLNGITELDVSSRAMPDVTCAQARFAEIQGIAATPRRPWRPHFPTLHRPRIRRIPVGSHRHRCETRKRRPRRHRSTSWA